MNRRGASIAEMVIGFVLAIGILVLSLTIYKSVSDKAEGDLVDFSGCIARGAQVGGRGVCSEDATCATVTPIGQNEYASPLGVSCPVKDGEKPQYCCLVIPRNRNPPAGDQTGAQGAVAT